MASLGAPITVRSVAARAGVSAMTVSRVLRNHPSVRPEVRARVLTAVEALGYRPHPLVAALMSWRRSGRTAPTQALAFLTGFATAEGWQRVPLIREFYAGATAAAARHGYSLEPFWLHQTGMTPRRMSSVLRHRGIQGIVVAPLPAPLGEIDLDWGCFAAVALGYTLARPQLHRAVNHQFRSLQGALKELRRRGFGKVGLAIRDSFDERVEHHWLGGYLVEQHRLEGGGPGIPPLVLPDVRWAPAPFLRWYRRNRPDVIVSEHPELLEWLKDAGHRVPEEVGFFHLNCPDPGGTFAGIYQNGPRIGELAVDQLVAQLHRHERGIPAIPHSVLVDGRWCEGRTLPASPPPRAPTGND